MCQVFNIDSCNVLFIVKTFSLNKNFAGPSSALSSEISQSNPGCTMDPCSIEFSSSSSSIEETRHALIGAVVASALILSVGSTPLYSILISLLLIMQVILFFHYDSLLASQRRIMQTRLGKSESYVNDLFPEPVRAQMLEQEQQDQEHGNKNIDVQDELVAPVWEEHPDATVLFADLKGFTKWSTRRNSIEVFRLLEALYSTMDHLALLHDVFKIETIGDCYLAVSGAPVTDPNHAVHMAEFANAMLRETTLLLQRLEEVLPGASYLGLRVGLHSGPVVLGVLRCSKKRLQIFGDTVNTASRMESTGRAGRIQMSAATANLLSLRHGKEHWCSKRSDGIVAKGLGSLVTYWLDTAATSSESITPRAAFLKKHQRSASSHELLESLVAWNDSMTNENLCSAPTRSKMVPVQSSRHTAQTETLPPPSLHNLPPPPILNRKLFLSSRSRSMNECVVTLAEV